MHSALLPLLGSPRDCPRPYNGEQSCQNPVFHPAPENHIPKAYGSAALSP